MRAKIEKYYLLTSFVHHLPNNTNSVSINNGKPYEQVFLQRVLIKLDDISGFLVQRIFQMLSIIIADLVLLYFCEKYFGMKGDAKCNVTKPSRY